LLRNGADKNLKDKNNKTALDYAKNEEVRNTISTFEERIERERFERERLERERLEREKLKLKEQNAELLREQNKQREQIDSLEKKCRELNQQNEQQQQLISDLISQQEVLNNERKAIDTQLLKLLVTTRDWIENTKFDQLKDVIAEEEYLKNQLTKKDNGELFKLQSTVTELLAKHKDINQRIRHEESVDNLIAERKKNLEMLNDSLGIFVTELENELQILDSHTQTLTRFIEKKNGTDTSPLELKRDISDVTYKELLRSKVQFEKDMESLMKSADGYYKNLKKAQERLDNSIKQGKKEIENQLKNKIEQKEALNLLLESYTGMKKNMEHFREKSEQVSELLNQYKGLEEKIIKIEDEVDDLECKCRKLNRALQKGEKDKQEGLKQTLKTKEEKEKELIVKKKEVQQLLKQLSSFYEFGEVSKLLLPKKNVDVSLEDYKFVRDLGGRNNNVSLYKNKQDQEVVLKKFLVGQDHSMLKRQEELLMNLPKNPLILPINRIFYKDEVAYVEMPYIEGGTLREWMKTKKSVREIQNMLRLIAQGINFLHNHDIIHCDLKPENILIRKMEETIIPVLCDFEFSRNRNTISTNTTIGGTYNYMSPELLNGKGKPSIAADVWAFGIIMLELFSNGTPLNTMTDQSSDSVRIYPNMLMNEIRSENSLFELLQHILKINPLDRYDMIQVLNHEFMLKVLNEEKKEANQNHIRALKQFINERSRKSFKESLSFSINANNIVQETLSKFSSMNEKNLLKRLVVKFVGEEGIDAGALTTALYSRFFKAAAEEMFEKLSSDSIAFIPKEDDGKESTIKQYKALGKLLFKVIYDQRTIPILIASYVIRYLISETVDEFGKMISIKDLDMVDIEYSNNLRLILAQNDATILGMDFSDVDPGNDTPLTNENRRQYIKKAAEYKLLNTRINNLRAMREGFRSVNEFFPYLNLLTEMDVVILISEQQYVDINILTKECIDFIGDSNQELAQRFIQVLKALNNNELQQFLHFATGQVGLYSAGSDKPLNNPNMNSPYNRNKISIRFYEADQEMLPVAHVCFYSIDMPKYATAEQMKTKLMQSIELSAGMFNVA
jgi:serine/threonine protein kinase